MNDHPVAADSAQEPASPSGTTPKATAPVSPFPPSPGDQSEPPNEWYDSVSTDDGWRALGVSVRGLDHEDAGSHRDDAFALAVVGPWLICAVADGVGSAKFSRFGAREAANASVTKIAENMRLLAMPDDTNQLTEGMRVGLMAALNAMRTYAECYARSLGDLSTTLLLVIHGHAADGTQLVVTAQVGDGAIAAFAPGDETSAELAFVQLASPDEGYSGGETIPFNALNPTTWPQRIQAFQLPAETVGVMLLTDGVSDAFKPWHRHLWRLMQFLRVHVTPVASANEALAQLRATMSFERPGMGDDRTLVLIHKPS